MGAPHLELVEPDDGRCGAPTRAGEPCHNPAGEDGRCWLPTHKDATAELPTEAPAPPEHLGEKGCEYWSYHVNRCMEAGVLKRVDLTVVEKAAEVAEIMAHCWKHVQKHGPDVPDKNGSTKTNPALSKFNSLIGDYRQLTKQIDGWVAQGSVDDGQETGGWSDW